MREQTRETTGSEILKPYYQLSEQEPSIKLSVFLSLCPRCFHAAPSPLKWPLIWLYTSTCQSLTSFFPFYSLPRGFKKKIDMEWWDSIRDLAQTVFSTPLLIQTAAGASHLMFYRTESIFPNTLLVVHLNMRITAVNTCDLATWLP